MLGNKMMPDHKPIPEADLRKMREACDAMTASPWSTHIDILLLLDEVDRLREGLSKSIILGVDVGSPLMMHKSGGTAKNIFLEGVEEHNARIDALLGEGEKMDPRADETRKEYRSRLQLEAHAEATRFPISLRDFFAGCALAGYCATSTIRDDPEFREFANGAYLQADAMLAAREE